MNRVEIIPEYEEQIRSLGDETPSDDTEEISIRKRKKVDTIPIPGASSKDKIV